MNKEEVKALSTINSILEILDNNFKYTFGKKIPYNEIFLFFKDLDVLFSSLEKHREKIGLLTVEKHIPLLDLIVKLDNNYQNVIDYDTFLKNAYRRAARISLEHYFVYREWEDRPEEKFFAPRQEMLKGFVYYLEQLEKNPNFLNLIANLPSGYGKTYTKKISEAWALGYKNDGTFLSLCSNDDVVKGGSRTVRQEIKSLHFGEVFSEMKYDKDDRDFFTKETDGLWALKTAKLDGSYLASTVKSNVVGLRASKGVHIDDLYQNHTEALDVTLTQRYYDDYLTVWRKRYVQHLEPKVCITGTLWASNDFIARVINYEQSNKNFSPHPKFKYTHISSDGTTAIIKVPALDYVTGLSTVPGLRSTEKLLEEKNSISEYLWETNFQQIPTDPEALMFSYNNLRTYDKLPTNEKQRSYSVIDATRKSGSDFFSMPIFVKDDTESGYDYYLKDALFTRTATKELYEEIVSKIIEHHIVLLVIESNVAEELKTNLERILEKLNVNFCEIRNKYSIDNKKIRIETYRSDVVRRILFPKKGEYGLMTHMGKFMENLTSYNHFGTTRQNDDAPDSLCLTASEIIEEKAQVKSIEIIKDIRKYI